MPNTDLSEGHNKTATSAGAYQFEGLRDTDVLSTTTLTNITENLLGNGVIPVGLNNYNDANRNNPIQGNCCVTPNGAMGTAKEITVATGTVCVDGMYYTVGGGAAIDITAAANYHADYHPGATPGGMAGANVAPIPNGTAATDEAILLVYVDPRGPQNIGFVYGSYVDTATGQYPSTPFAHLVRQTTVLAWLRIGKGGANPVIHQVEDKRTFIRAGPMALSSLIDKDNATDHENPRNDMIAGLNAANLPITDMGLLYARDPTAHNIAPEGAGQTHLFYQTDVAPLTSFQLTPVHRQSKAVFPWIAPMTLNYGAAPAAGGLSYTPLQVIESNAGAVPATPLWLVKCTFVSRAAADAVPEIVMNEGNGLITSSATQLTIGADPGFPVFGGLPYDHVIVEYTHAGK